MLSTEDAIGRRQQFSLEGRVCCHGDVADYHVVPCVAEAQSRRILTKTTLVQMALRILNLRGHSKVTVVREGQQAVDEIHRQGGPDAFDIILTDLQMPHKVPLLADWLLPLGHM